MVVIKHQVVTIMIVVNKEIVSQNAGLLVLTSVTYPDNVVVPKGHWHILCRMEDPKEATSQ